MSKTYLLVICLLLTPFTGCIEDPNDLEQDVEDTNDLENWSKPIIPIHIFHFIKPIRIYKN